MAARLLAVAVIAWTILIGIATSIDAAELVMFEERGCPWCERWRAEVGVAYPKTPEGQRAPLRRADLGKVKASGVTLLAPVMVSPTFVLTVQGREVGRITGYPGPDFFWPMLTELLAKLDARTN